MSAINCVRRRDAVHLFTDAALYDVDGVIRAFATKALPIAHHPSAIAVRGPHGALIHLFLELSKFLSFDALVDGIEGEAPKYRKEMFNTLATNVVPLIELWVVGFSVEREKLESYAMYLVGDYGEEKITAGFKPYQLVELDRTMYGPSLAEVDCSHLDARKLTDFDNVSMVREMVKIVELQRSQKYPTESGKANTHVVGGWLSDTLVTPEGVSQIILKRWPKDKIGELLQPDLHEVSASNVTPLDIASMSRQQRRYYERQERKAAAKTPPASA